MCNIINADNNSSVLNRIGRQLEPDGYLVLGAAETVVGLTDAFRPIADKRGLYAPNKDRPLAARPSLTPLRPLVAAAVR